MPNTGASHRHHLPIHRLPARLWALPRARSTHKLTLEDLGREAKDVVDHDDGLLGVLVADLVRLDTSDLAVRALGCVVGRDGGEGAASWVSALPQLQ